jgi:hypothetical protein
MFKKKIVLEHSDAHENPGWSCLRNVGIIERLVRGGPVKKNVFLLLFTFVALSVVAPLALADDSNPPSAAVQAAQDKVKADRTACHQAQQAAGKALRAQLKAAHDQLEASIKAEASQATIDAAKAKIKADAVAARAQMKTAREACRAQLKSDRAALKAAREDAKPSTP